MNYVDQEIDVLDSSWIGTSIKHIVFDHKHIYLEVGEDKKIYITKVTKDNPFYNPELASDPNVSLIDILQE